MMNGIKPCIMRMVSDGSLQTKQSPGPVREGVEVDAANIAVGGEVGRRMLRRAVRESARLAATPNPFFLVDVLYVEAIQNPMKYIALNTIARQRQ